MAKGWRGDSLRHSLAARGVRTANKIKNNIIQRIPLRDVRDRSSPIIATSDDWIVVRYESELVRVNKQGIAFWGDIGTDSLMPLGSKQNDEVIQMIENNSNFRLEFVRSGDAEEQFLRRRAE